MTTPISDLISFLTGDTGDFNALGPWKYLMLLILYAATIASFVLVFLNWRDDPTQRQARNVWMYGSRVFIGYMWFTGCLWKLPFSVNNGLHFWTEQTGLRSAYEWHRDFINHLVLPYFALVNPVVFLAEFGFALALITGLYVRLASFGAILLTLNLWLGLYNTRPGDVQEWPWNYIFLIFVHGYFLADAAGRGLGADAWLRRRYANLIGGSGLGAFLLRFT